MKKSDLNYIAGLFDGEGTIYWNDRNKKGSGWPCVAIFMIDREGLELIHKYYPHKKGKLYIHSPEQLTPLGNKRQLQYGWKVQGQRAVNFLNEILPYLKLKRRIEKAKEVINQWNNRPEKYHLNKNRSTT